WRAALIGLAQGAAISPGVSRSGATICIALLLGIKRRWAAEFSFLIAVPAILGATVIKFSEAMRLPANELAAVSWGAMIAGAAVALVTGVIALRFLLKVVVQDKLSYFSYYCWALGIGAVLFA
ncbi:MAG: undecaprenyl-diphosphate phosphatase, partial [Phycisphaerales bacterium]|nr:undecaprenyl-diphosphate phosphatase [Phycisphaerales bacterium]